MLAIIGGSGLSRFPGDAPRALETVPTPFAEAPVEVAVYQGAGQGLAFLPRHGQEAAIPPHRINYRANLWALDKLGADRVLGINVVGGIHEDMAPGVFMVPDQLIDYTWGRPGTFFEDGLEQVTHIDFTCPFDAAMRSELLEHVNGVNATRAQPQTIIDGGVYACTQGPRLETAAEIRRLQRDGCDIVGMTAMPEAALARELGLGYAVLALSVNWGAGLAEGEISMEEIGRVIDDGMGFVSEVLRDLLG